MKKVLVLEDSGEIYDCFVENINDQNLVEILPAYQISEAEYLFKNASPDFLIIDLYVEPTGLSKTETDNSSNGKLSGWLWLKNYVFKDEAWKQKTIIYSEYINLLESKEIKENLRSVIRMEKKKYNPSDVIERMNKLLKI